MIAEGIESTDELDALRDMGVELFQGYLFANPGFETLPEIRLPYGTGTTSEHAPGNCRALHYTLHII
ncbi:MAG: EAL domain-containing protein [Pseudomonas sp.]|uniref:EAL domain-containing protein n=1 Tax=Pseudomonas sp. TaxID=306 RepID=UPI003BB5DBCA